MMTQTTQDFLKTLDGLGGAIDEMVRGKATLTPGVDFRAKLRETREFMHALDLRCK